MSNAWTRNFYVITRGCLHKYIRGIKMGYSLIDTANAYVNERAVGRAIKDSGIDRKIYFYQQKYGLVNMKMRIL